MVFVGGVERAESRTTGRNGLDKQWRRPPRCFPAEDVLGGLGRGPGVWATRRYWWIVGDEPSAQAAGGAAKRSAALLQDIPRRLLRLVLAKLAPQFPSARPTFLKDCKFAPSNFPRRRQRRAKSSRMTLCHPT